MKKDIMSGEALWLSYQPDPAVVDTTWKNPWAKEHYDREGEGHLDDCGGLTLFRRVFNVTDLRSAKIRASALGVFDLWCNGKRVGVRGENGVTRYDEMKPGWTDYHVRTLHYTYDISEYLQNGENVILAVLSNGWYNGQIANGIYGYDGVTFIAELEIDDANGLREIFTDTSWQASFGGALRTADIYGGEVYNANFPSFASLSLTSCRLVWHTPTASKKDIIISPNISEPVRVREHLALSPVSISVYSGIVDNGSDYGRVNTVSSFNDRNSFTLSKDQTAVIDFGQNMAGIFEFDVSGKQNTSVQVRVAEMLNDSGMRSRGNDGAEGSAYTANYRRARSKVYYILGDSDGHYLPTHTFFGYRYLEFSCDGDVCISNLRALPMGSDLRETGNIITSNAEVNRLFSNILWGQRSNYLSIPTDCPQRDERLGWTGDTQLFCNTAAYNADVRLFFHKWLCDLRDCQQSDGAYRNLVPPSHMAETIFGATAWADAGITVPYVIWKMYGDTDIIREHYDSMERYMAWLESRGFAGPICRYGDWLAYEPTDAELVSVAYYAYDASLMASMCRVIGKAERADRYTKLFGSIKAHFISLFCDGDGYLLPQHRTQTAFLMALKFDLLPQAVRAESVRLLKEKIIDNRYMLSTGFIGTCILNQVLADNGENNLAYSLLLQTKDPSWLYSVHQGATTIWERWNSYTIERGFGNPDMNSFNHYAYGAVAEWMYRHMAGIECDESSAGFTHVILQPKPDTRTDGEIPEGQERITHVKAYFDAPTGRIRSEWSLEDGFEYTAEVPVGATLYLPVLYGDTFTVNGDKHRFDEYKRDGNCVVIPLNAGKYTFIQK